MAHPTCMVWALVALFMTTSAVVPCCDYADIATAISTATDNSVVYLAPGTFTLGSAPLMSDFKPSARIHVIGGPSTVDCQWRRGPVFSFSGSDVGDTLEQVTITNCSDYTVRFEASGTVSNCTFAGNSGSLQVVNIPSFPSLTPPINVVNSIFINNLCVTGALLVQGGSTTSTYNYPFVKVLNSTFTANSGGGAITTLLTLRSPAPGTPNILVDGCVFERNSGPFYGAIWMSSPQFPAQSGGSVITFAANGLVNILRSTFLNNSVSLDATTTSGAGGGAVRVGYSSEMNNYDFDVQLEPGFDVLLDNCTFVDNFSIQHGGAVFSHSNSVTIRASTFTANTATLSGGAVFVKIPIFPFGTTTNIEDSAFVDNTAGENGGALAVHTAPLVVSTSTFTNNIALGDGAGVWYLQDSSLSLACPDANFLKLLNSTIAHNSASTGCGGGLFIADLNLMPIGYRLFAAELSGTLITTNSALRGGGFCYQSSATSLVQAQSIIGPVTISDNYASLSGGGFCFAPVQTTPAALVDIIFADFSVVNNRAAQNGGGVFVDAVPLSSRHIRLEDSAVTGNSCGGNGGGVSVSGISSITVAGGTFSSNTVGSVAGQGGGIHVDGAKVTLIDVSMATNMAGRGGGFYCGAGTLVTGVGVVAHDNLAPATIPTTLQGECEAGCAGCCPVAASVIPNDATCFPSYNATCTFTCATNYTSQSPSALCLAGDPPCIPDPCPPLVADHAQLTYSRGVNARGLYNSSTTATLLCDNGFVSVDGNVVTCTAGAWSNQRCIPRGCNVTLPLHGAASSTYVQVHDTTTFSCDAGYMLVGARTLTCDADLKFDNSLPTCESTRCEVDTTKYAVDCQAPVLLNTSCTVSCSYALGYAGVSVTGVCEQVADEPGVFSNGLPTCEDCSVNVFANEATGRCQSCVNAHTNRDHANLATDCHCNNGYYTLDTSLAVCTPCMTGAVCDGDEEPPRAQAGYYEAANLIFLACTPVDACPGNKSCAPGYTDYLCAKCDVNYYKLNGQCRACPNDANARLYGAIVVLAFVILLLVMLAQPSSGGLNVSFASPTIFLSFAQITATIGKLNFPWPPALLSMFDIFTSLNLDISLANPECTIRATFYDKLVAQLVLPLIVLAMYVLAFLVVWGAVWYRLRHAARATQWNRTGEIVERFVAGYMFFLTIAYLFLAQTSLSLFACKPQADGNSVIAQSLSDHCYTDEWKEHVGWAVFGVVVYVILFPASLVAIFMYLRWRHSAYTPLQHRLTNFYVHRYMAVTWYWELVVLLRKLLVVLFAVFLVENSVLQAGCCAAVLFFAAIATAAVRPFRYYVHDIIELVSLGSSLLVIFAGFVFNAEGLGETGRTAVSTFVVVIVIISVVSMGICFLAESWQRVQNIYRNYVHDPCEITFLASSGGPVSAVASTTDFVVAGSETGAITIWDKNAELKSVHRLLKAGKSVRMAPHTSIAAAHDGRVLATAVVHENLILTVGADGVIRSWSLQDGAKSDERKLAYTPTAAMFSVAAGHEGDLLVGDAEGGLHYLVGPGNGSASSATGDRLPSPVWDESVFVGVAVTCVAARDGTIACGSADGQVHELAVDGGKVHLADTPRKLGRDAATALCLAPNGRGDKSTMLLIVGMGDGSLVGLPAKPTQSRESVRYLGHQEAVLAVQVQDAVVISVSRDWTVQLHDRESGALLQAYFGHAFGANALSLFTENTFFTGGDDGRVKQWTYKHEWDTNTTTAALRCRARCCTVDGGRHPDWNVAYRALDKDVSTHEKDASGLPGSGTGSDASEERGARTKMEAFVSSATSTHSSSSESD